MNPNGVSSFVRQKLCYALTIIVPWHLACDSDGHRLTRAGLKPVCEELAASELIQRNPPGLLPGLEFVSLKRNEEENVVATYLYFAD